MILFRILSLLLASLTVALSAFAAEKSGHLFILSGQSNMTGNLKKGFTATVNEALGEDNVTIVQCARPGRGIRFWVADYKLPEAHPMQGLSRNSSNGEEFTRLVQTVKDNCDARSYKTVSLIWMQGESDANRDLGVAYERSFTTLLSRLKKELGLDKMHFVIGRISDYGLHADKADGWKRMRAVQQKIAEDVPLGAWIDTDDLNGGDASKPQGDLHYPNEQSVLLGQRFARAALVQLGLESKE